MIRKLESSDVPELVEKWNRSLIHDPITEEKFRYAVLEDPNCEAAGNLVAVDQGGITGFVSAVVREGIKGRDGRGRPEEKDDGYIKAIFVDEGRADHDEIGRELIEAAEGYIKSKGKRVVKVVLYTGRYLFPGVDLRYERLLRLFEAMGYRRIATIDDLAVDLRSYAPTEYQLEAKRRAERLGVRVEGYRPEMLDAMRRFVEKLNMPHWFPEGWEQRYAEERGNTLVALKGGEIVGWANFGTGEGRGWFGPIAVLEEYRGNGIGSWLLMESCLRMKEAGAPMAIASWAATGFYLKNGWHIHRQYAAFRKELGR
ncbi:hypothetical protein DRP77_04655 [Candidatus Poribacteria bacterium]|nr:MAG: hypothetical protein DRP77_04655 [Candidatus Poribacteria bacterium]